MSREAARHESSRIRVKPHGQPGLKNLSALEGPNGPTLQGRSDQPAFYPWAAATQAYPGPRLFNLNPCGVGRARGPGGKGGIQIRHRN